MPLFSSNCLLCTKDRHTRVHAWCLVFSSTVINLAPISKDAYDQVTDLCHGRLAYQQVHYAEKPHSRKNVAGKNEKRTSTIQMQGFHQERIRYNSDKCIKKKKQMRQGQQENMAQDDAESFNGWRHYKTFRSVHKYHKLLQLAIMFSKLTKESRKSASSKPCLRYWWTYARDENMFHALSMMWFSGRTLAQLLLTSAAVFS